MQMGNTFLKSFFRRYIMSRREYMIRKLKREIRKEIAVETAALKKLIPLFVGSAVLCAGGYAWSILLFGIL